jgi:multidrug efflux pump subunit AcrB
LVINPAIASTHLEGSKEMSKKAKLRFWLIVGVSLTVGILLNIIGKPKGDTSLITIGTILAVIGVIALLNRYFLEPVANYVMNVLLVKLERGYGKFLAFWLKGYKPFYLFLSIIVMMIVVQGWYFGSNPKIEFFPKADPKYINVFVEMPIGTDIEETNQMALRVEKIVEKTIAKDRDIVETVLAQVGTGTADPMNGPDLGANPHKARINVNFLDFADRKGKSTAKIMEEVREAVRRVPGAIISVAQDPNGPPVGYPINIEISGDEYDQLTSIANTLKKQLTALDVPGVEGLKSDLETGKPELNIYVDREAVRRYGISTAQVAQEIRTSLFGKEISKFKEGEDDYPIVVRNAVDKRYDLSSILENKITYQNPSNGQFFQVPISAVADIQYASSYGAIKRLDMDRVVTVYSNVLDGYNATEIVEQYKEYLENVELPQGYEVKITGEQQEQSESSEFLGTAFMIALFLVFLIIVAQFNSITSPFIIMFSVIFSTIGVFGGLAMFDMPFVVMMSGIGIISLAGVVVNNAIVLIDYAVLSINRRKVDLNLSEDDILPRNELEAQIVNTGKTRLRPVLLTALTTVLGLVPLAIGLNIDFIKLVSEHDPHFYIGGDNVAFWGPMSWTVIFGLTFATFLTLVVVPAMYLLAERLKAKFRKPSAESIENN